MVDAGGNNLRTRRPRYNDLVIIGKIREKRMKGWSLAANAVCLDDKALFISAERSFGSWDEALRNAGIEPPKSI